MAHSVKGSSQTTHPGLAANEAYFNEIGDKLNDFPFAYEYGQYNAEAMRAVYPFDAASTEVMDFACGTGLISKNLLEHCKSIVGVDISQSMVDEYNKLADKIAPNKMHAARLALTGAEGELEGRKFDVIVCAMSYHHLPSTVDTTRVLAHFLKPGGALVVVDIHNSPENDFSMWATYQKATAKAQGHGHSHSHDHSNIHSHSHDQSTMLQTDHHDHHDTHHDHKQATILNALEHAVSHKGGFLQGDMRSVFEAAGLEDFKFELVAREQGPDWPVELFVAKASKPASKL
ncbi:hypothetical protein HGRIS_013749 [Hohenbuehelia grisea]|uniref:Methyltransferase type 12 domain-containing protein n=1 Tax=Hohenbuehelia grisea TaxID=104357 RepID=A0ABR3IWI5_9AGAR